MSTNATLPPSAKAIVDSLNPPLQAPKSEKEQAALSDWLARLSSGKVYATPEDLTELDKELTPKTYLVGNQLSVGDVALYAVVHPAVAKLTPTTYYTLPSLVRWFDHIQHSPSLSGSSTQLQKVEFDLENAPKAARNEAPAKVKKEKAPASSALAVEGKKEKAPKEKSAKQPPAAKEKEEDSTPVPSMIDLRVGHIIDVQKHPDADGLYVEQIDIGEPTGPRTVVSGLVNYIPIEQMRDRWLVAVCNLKPASMRGVKSFAMVLCATAKEGKEHGIEVVEVPENSRVPGEKVYFEGSEFEGKEPLVQLNPKKKIFETLQPGFITLDSRETAWTNKETGTVHKIRTKEGVCYVPSLVGASLS